MVPLTNPRTRRLDVTTKPTRVRITPRSTLNLSSLAFWQVRRKVASCSTHLWGSGEHERTIQLGRKGIGLDLSLTYLYENAKDRIKRKCYRY